MKTKLLFLTFIISSFIFKSCAPVFSELQSARTVGKNRVEITPSYSSVSFTSENNANTAEVQKEVGLQVAYGLSSNTDIRIRYEYIWLSDNSSVKSGINVLGMGPKYCIIKDIFSFYLPVGFAFGKDINESKSWEIHPTLLISMPLAKNKVEINISPKYLIAFVKNSDDLLAFNFGVSFSDDLSKWAVRPEYGLLYNPGNSGYYSHFSIGFSMSFGK